MGNEAVKEQETIDQDQFDTEQEVEETPEVEDSETEGSEEQESEGSEGDDQKEPEDHEVEVVLEGEETQLTDDKTPPYWMRQKINKFKGKIAEVEAKADERIAELERENQSLRATYGQGPPAKSDDKLAPPNPDDFDGGAYDPEYVKAANEYSQQVIQREVRKSIEEANQQYTSHVNQQATDAAFEKAAAEHWQRAAQLKLKDYDETENKAIEVLGLETAKYIMANEDASERVLYYLGKNPQKAMQIESLLKANPYKGVSEIGKLASKITVRPKTTTHAPNPDEELEGGKGSARKFRGPKGATYE